MVEFQYHNIELEDNSQTIPGTPLFYSDQGCQEALRILGRRYPVRNQRQLVKVADLGCLEGGHSVEFARAGFNVTGIEIREKNFALCEKARNGLNLPLLRFVQDDVRNISRYGNFDAIFAGGILYHLPNPVEFLKLLFDAANDGVIINTHFATPDCANQFHEAGKLSAVVNHEGYAGRWYTEYADGKRDQTQNWARVCAWGNDLSFWLLKEELQRALCDIGFVDVMALFDPGANPAFVRGTFVAWKR
jgi:hypothetical protein